MKLIQIIVAASILVPAVSSFAQSTPPAVDADVRAQLALEKPTYQSFDSNAKQNATSNTVRRNGGQSRQIAGVNVGRYSMSVVGPAF
ncbi:hypothetical protein P3T18_000291 [Paraburkholderia sp. GAS199]|uniref:hypothetical protein n=1 Tax=Paraburkholderia sp. GAS199 TaxID=3035126 RepID=UPI003D25E099